MNHNLQNLIPLWVRIKNDHVRVMAIPKDSQSPLQLDDEILQFNGQPIRAITQAKWHALREEDTEVELKIIRGEQAFSVTLPTTAGTEQ